MGTVRNLMFGGRAHLGVTAVSLAKRECRGPQRRVNAEEVGCVWITLAKGPDFSQRRLNRSKDSTAETAFGARNKF